MRVQFCVALIFTKGFVKLSGTFSTWIFNVRENGSLLHVISFADTNINIVSFTSYQVVKHNL